MYRLIVAIGSDKGRAFKLEGMTPLVLGRRNANILLTDHNVSRQHAQLLVREGAWWIIDLRSTNGTFINGSRLSQAHKLEHGDQLQVGRSVMVFQSIAALKRGNRPQTPQQPQRTAQPPTLDPNAIDALERHIAARIERDNAELPQAAGPKQRPAMPTAPPKGPAQRNVPQPGMPIPRPVPNAEQTKPPQPVPSPPEAPPYEASGLQPARAPEVAPPEVAPPQASPPQVPPPDTPKAQPPEPEAPVADVEPSPAEPVADKPQPPVIDTVDEPATESIADIEVADAVPSPHEPTAPDAAEPDDSLEQRAVADLADIEPEPLEADSTADPHQSGFAVTDDAQPITASSASGGGGDVELEVEVEAEIDQTTEDSATAAGSAAGATTEAPTEPQQPLQFGESPAPATRDDAEGQQLPDGEHDAALLAADAPQATTETAGDDTAEPHAGARDDDHAAVAAFTDAHDNDHASPPTGDHMPDDDAPFVAYADDARWTGPSENGHHRFDAPAVTEPAYVTDERPGRVHNDEHALVTDTADATYATAGAAVGEDAARDAMFETVAVAVAVVDDQPEAFDDDRLGLAPLDDAPTLLAHAGDDPSDEREYLSDRLLADEADLSGGAVGRDGTANHQAVRADLEDDASIDAFLTMFLDTERTTFPSREALDIDELFDVVANSGDHAVVDDLPDATDVAHAAPPGDTEAVTNEPDLTVIDSEADEEILDELSKPPPKPVDFEKLRRPVHDDDHDAGSTSLLYATEQAVEETAPEPKVVTPAPPPVEPGARPETPDQVRTAEEDEADEDIDYYAWEERQRQINRTKLIVAVVSVLVLLTVSSHILMGIYLFGDKKKTITPMAPAPAARAEPQDDEPEETSEDRFDAVKSAIRNQVENLDNDEQP